MHKVKHLNSAVGLDRSSSPGSLARTGWDTSPGLLALLVSLALPVLLALKVLLNATQSVKLLNLSWLP